MDHNIAQINYIQERKRRLSDGDYESFLRVVAPGTQDVNYGERCFENSLDRRNHYFREGGRLDRIRARSRELEINEGDIFKIAARDKEFTKIYLSNAISHKHIQDGRKGEQYIETPTVLRNAGRNLSLGGLIYISDHKELTSLFRSYNHLPQEEDLELREDILPPELKLARELTGVAQRLDNGLWTPAVYQKITP